MKRLAFLLAFLLTGCLALPTAEPTVTASPPQILSSEENPYLPKIEDVGMIRAGVVLTAIQLSERVDLDPTRVQIHFLGSMPSTCNELRLVVKPPDVKYRVYIEAYSMTNPGAKCESVFQQFETDILLGVYSPGRYTIWVNDTYVGDFSSY